MRLLLDENLPKRLKLDFPEHELILYVIKDGMVSKMVNF